MHFVQKVILHIDKVLFIDMKLESVTLVLEQVIHHPRVHLVSLHHDHLDVHLMPGNGPQDVQFCSFNVEAEKVYCRVANGLQYEMEWKALDFEAGALQFVPDVLEVEVVIAVGKATHEGRAGKVQLLRVGVGGQADVGRICVSAMKQLHFDLTLRIKN